MQKMTPSDISTLLTRKRLFDLLDKCCRLRCIWLCGAAGSGKTLLLESYLRARGKSASWYRMDSSDVNPSNILVQLNSVLAQPEEQVAMWDRLHTHGALGMAQESHQLFRTFFRTIGKSHYFIFDNVELVSESPSALRALQIAIDEVDDGTTIVLCSRDEPPTELAHAITAGKIGYIGSSDLILTLDDVRDLMSSNEIAPEKDAESVFKLIAHWEPGLALEAIRTGVSDDSHAMSLPLTQAQRDYFDVRVFSKFSKELQDFLMWTACLPELNAEMAQTLFATERVASYLEFLNRNRLFTKQLSVQPGRYRYSPVFRRFLLERLDAGVPEDVQNRLRFSAANLLCADGQFSEAIALYLALDQWELAIPLICKQAARQFAKGQVQLLRTWIDKIPSDLLIASSWLSYWLGRCDLHFGEISSRRHFHNAYGLMKEGEDTIGVILVVAAIIESYYLEWNDLGSLDDWIAELEKEIAQVVEYPSDEVETSALRGLVIGLVVRHPSHSMLPVWTQRLLSLLENSDNLNLNQLVVTGTLILDFAQINCDSVSAARVIQRVRPLLSHVDVLPVNHVLWLFCHARYQNFAGNVDLAAESDRFSLVIKSERNLDTLESLLFVQKMMFDIERFDGATLRGGDTQEALDQLISKSHALRRLDIAWLFQSKALLYALQGRLDYAIQFAKMALDFASQRGATTLRLIFLRFLAGLYAKQGNVDEARRYLQLAQAHSPAGAARYFECRMNLLDAGVALQKGNLPGAKRLLQSALTSAQQEGAHSPAWWPLNVTRLYHFSLTHGIEADFFQNLAPQREVLNVENQQWPIKIHALGRFEIFIDETQFFSSGKAQRKPLDLLKCLIALGGMQVSSLTLIHYLWPDSDGDAAQATFDSTVLRLRRLLQRADAILVSDGLVSINPKIVWIDTWAFEKLAGKIESIDVFESTGKTVMHGLTESMRRLYQGHFLGHEEERPWTLTMRERLRSKWLRVLTMTGAYWEAMENWDAAAELYQRGLELDSLVEDIYRRLMHVHHRRGQLSSVLDVYRRCRMMLSVVLGIKPSAETEAMYKSIVADHEPEIRKRRSTDKV